MGSRVAGHFVEAFRRAGESSPKAEFVDAASGYRIVTRTMHPFGNFAIVDPGISLEELDELAAPLAELEMPSSVFFKSDPATKEQDAALTALGFAGFGAMPLMAVDNATLAGAKLPDGFEFRQIGESEREGWTDALAVGYEIPYLLSEMFADLDGESSEFALYGAFDGPAVVSTSMTFAYDGLMGIYGVATRANYRGMGLGAFMTAEPLRRARAEGWDTGILQASEMGFPIYRRLGFEQVGGMAMYFRMAGV